MIYHIVTIDRDVEVIVASATDFDTACAVQELLGDLNPGKDFCLIRPNQLIESIEYAGSLESSCAGCGRTPQTCICYSAYYEEKQ